MGWSDNLSTIGGLIGMAAGPWGAGVMAFAGSAIGSAIDGESLTSGSVMGKAALAGATSAAGGTLVGFATKKIFGEAIKRLPLLFPSLTKAFGKNGGSIFSRWGHLVAPVKRPVRGAIFGAAPGAYGGNRLGEMFFGRDYGTIPTREIPYKPVLGSRKSAATQASS
ncbi:hypothetical protein [Nocardia yamanashiensis]|uniref:hypothetical protein n=1 Tax=Nocardia yamanashiensis TaxID=209247 RepID=UPI0012FD86DC|nr:hypothetical protein [Nocardia yamanashiensis]